MVLHRILIGTHPWDRRWTCLRSRQHHSQESKVGKELKPQALTHPAYSFCCPTLTVVRSYKSEYPIQDYEYSIINSSRIPADVISKGHIK